MTRTFKERLRLSSPEPTCYVSRWNVSLFSQPGLPEPKQRVFVTLAEYLCDASLVLGELSGDGSRVCIAVHISIYLLQQLQSWLWDTKIWYVYSLWCWQIRCQCNLQEACWTSIWSTEAGQTACPFQWYDTFMITFDLQKTLPLPKLSTNVAPYLRQLWLYNLGIHLTCKDRSQPYFNIWT